MGRGVTISLSRISPFGAPSHGTTGQRSFEQQRERLAAERAEILGRRSAWLLAQERIADVRAWCNRVAKNIDRLTFAEKRDALVALDVRVKLWRADHEPRYEITASSPPGSV